VHFYKLECPKENETKYLANIQCKISNLKNGSYSITSKVDLALPITYADISFKMFFRSSNKVMVNTSFEYCSANEGLPPRLKIVFSYLEKYSNDLIHACPYPPRKGFGVENFIVDPQSPILGLVNFQRGDYKSSVYIRDKQNQMIFYSHSFYSISLKKARKAGKK